MRMQCSRAVQTSSENERIWAEDFMGFGGSTLCRTRPMQEQRTI